MAKGYAQVPDSAGCRSRDFDALPRGETVLGPRINIEISNQREIASFVIMPPHEGLGTRHCGGIESPQVGVTRKDGIGDANDCEKSCRDRKGAKPRPLRLLASAHAFFSSGGLSGVARGWPVEPRLQSFESDAGLVVHAPAHQEKIENRKPDATRGIGKLSLEKGAFTLCREPVSDFGSDLRRGCRDRPQTRRLSLRHLPYTASLSAARDEFFGDLFADQERMIYRPPHSARCGVSQGPIRWGGYVIEHHADRSMNVDLYHYSGHGCSSDDFAAVCLQTSHLATRRA
jgi:hypothetical protein